MIHALNQAAVPAVGEATPAHVALLMDLAAHVWLAELADRVAGFVMLFGPGSTYGSPNYRWFCERYASFVYVDRVVVADDLRGRRIGEAMYRAAAREGLARGASHVLAEVNLAPPNPGSSRFHRRLGFARVGTLQSAPDKAVEMLAWPLVP